MAELQRAEIVKRIKQARKEAGLTQSEMADLIGVADRTYQNYEDFRVPWALMGKIGEVTDKSLVWLLHGRESPDTSRQINHIETMLVALLDYHGITDPGEELEDLLGEDDLPSEDTDDDNEEDGPAHEATGP